MDKTTIDKLHELEKLANKADYIITNGQPCESSIHYLYNFSPEFKADLNQLWFKYREYFKNQIKEL